MICLTSGGCKQSGRRLTISIKRDDRGAPPSDFGGRIAKMRNEHRSRQHTPHCFPLNSDATPMNNAQSAQPDGVCFFQIGLGDAFDIPRQNRVEVEDVRYR